MSKIRQSDDRAREREDLCSLLRAWRASSLASVGQPYLPSHRVVSDLSPGQSVAVCEVIWEMQLWSS